MLIKDVYDQFFDIKYMAKIFPFDKWEDFQDRGGIPKWKIYAIFIFPSGKEEEVVLSKEYDSREEASHAIKDILNYEYLVAPFEPPHG